MFILTINQNIFGSSFESISSSNSTENAINSEFIIPNSELQLCCEEMEYVDKGQYVSNDVLELMVDWTQDWN